MKYILWLALLASASFFMLAALAQDEPKKEIKHLSPDSELKTWVHFVDSQVEINKQTNGQAGIVPADVPYLYFFSSYDAPEELRKDVETSLAFALNSCMHFQSAPYVRKPSLVPGSTTLWYIDIRDYGWTREQFDVIFGQQPFFLDPLIDHRLYNYARLKMGNVMFRADWFIVNALDTTWQLDRDEKNLIYYVLLYGKDNEPKDAADFQKFWQVDKKTLEVELVETGALVDQGHSGVSKHTRQLRRGRTVFGYYHETRDVKAYQKKRDFIEDPFATNFDASELIASNKAGLQVYLLTNGNAQGQKRVEFADNAIVTDKSDTEDARVRTPKSCIVCHAVGINPATNDFAELIKAGGKLNVYEKKVQLALESFYLNEWGQKVKDDNKLFADSVKKATGLDPLKATASFVKVYDWYRKNVTQEQAARECGMSVADYLKNVKPTATGRLTQLFRNQDIPREVWDSTEAGGGYIQSMLLAKRIQAVPRPEKIKAAEKEVPKKKVVVITASRTSVYTNDKVSGYLNEGTEAEVLDESENGYLIRSGSTKGWVHKDYAKPK